jgi:superfamily I DNA/RNA helicase
LTDEGGGRPQFQDTSELQYDIAVQLAHVHQSLTVVGACLPYLQRCSAWGLTLTGDARLCVCMCLCTLGDPDQSIYGWRNANVANLSSRIQREFGGHARTVRLGEGYRSTQAILNSAHHIIAQGPAPLPTGIHT